MPVSGVNQAKGKSDPLKGKVREALTVGANNCSV